MIRYIIVTLLLFFSTISYAHEMTPTYPEWRFSSYDGLLVTEMQMFNKRVDVEYYEITVLDENMQPIPFVSSYSILRLDYLSRIKFEVYIRESDRLRAVYLCSRSKSKSSVSSMICSKFKS